MIIDYREEAVQPTQGLSVRGRACTLPYRTHTTATGSPPAAGITRMATPGENEGEPSALRTLALAVSRGSGMLCCAELTYCELTSSITLLVHSSG